ncbi:phosphoribosyltransferase [Haloarcula salina]|uniref:phosphoribosyltransferase n=1 Tax=Haloarcula salina TaxID=1429914 RepID=UPI003C6FA9D4
MDSNRQPVRFADREDAGKRLGTALRERDLGIDIVLAIPRGGLPLGRAVADALSVPLDIAVAQKMGAPDNPEFAVGAVASDGSVWLNDEAIDGRGVSREYVERTRLETAEAARQKEATYRGSRSPPELRGKRVCLVDDGVATGATVRACIERIRGEDPARIVLAVPVGSPRTITELESLVEEVVCLETPSSFRAVGQFYERFDQVSDENARSYLAG